jgi:hypothetical protein
MTLPNWIAWPYLRLIMNIAVLRLWWKGMPWGRARRAVAEATSLYMNREIHPQFTKEK